jgi:hypothetical protein
MARVPIGTTDRDEFGGMRRQFSGRKTDGQEATNALVAKWRSSHAAGSSRYDEWPPTSASSRAATKGGVAASSQNQSMRNSVVIRLAIRSRLSGKFSPSEPVFKFTASFHAACLSLAMELLAQRNK